MPTVTFLRGLPGSGKSTWAKEEVQKNGHGIVRVNKDDLRAMCHNSIWGKSNEKLICEIRDNIIISALASGRNVIVDDTNFHPKHEEHIKGIAHKMLASFTTKFFDVPLEECIARDAFRGNKSVGEKVIRDMHKQYLMEDRATPFKHRDQDKSLPKAIIVDIDGTVAGINGRSPYDHSRVSTDFPQTDIIELVTLLQEQGFKLIFCSGRKAVCRQDTIEWLMKYGFSPVDYLLLMRKDGDSRKDYIVKTELFNEHIDGKYYIKYVFDDRAQVCEGWRELGLRVLQVAKGDF